MLGLTTLSVQISVVQIKDGGRKWLFHLPMKQQRVSSAGEEM